MPRGPVHANDPAATGRAIAAMLARAAATLAERPERFVGADGGVVAGPFNPALAAGEDVTDLIYLVMMAAAQSAQEDLRRIMDQVKELTDEKKRWRTVAAALASYQQSLRADAGGYSVAAAEATQAQAQVKRRLDEIGDMGELESVRLQLAMDRLSKLMSTLSNLLKKLGDTAQSITQNLK